jgi:hypothetical protein
MVDKRPDSILLKKRRKKPNNAGYFKLDGQTIDCLSKIWMKLAPRLIHATMNPIPSSTRNFILMRFCEYGYQTLWPIWTIRALNTDKHRGRDKPQKTHGVRFTIVAAVVKTTGLGSSQWIMNCVLIPWQHLLWILLLPFVLSLYWEKQETFFQALNTLYFYIL